MGYKSTPGECALRYSGCTHTPAPGRKSCVSCLDTKRKFPSTTRNAVLSRVLNQTHKRDAFAAYGGARCTCCGETEFSFLTLDHVNSDGSTHQTTPGRRGVRYHQLKQRGWPNDPPLQVLCFNCNCGKKVNGGVCPHKTHTPEGIVYITWADASDADGTWTDAGEAKTFSNETCTVHSIGYIIAKTKLYITLARDFIPSTGAYGAVTKVPVGMILSMERMPKAQAVAFTKIPE